MVLRAFELEKGSGKRIQKVT